MSLEKKSSSNSDTAPRASFPDFSRGRAIVLFLVMAGIFSLYCYRQIWVLVAPLPGQQNVNVRDYVGRLHSNDFKHLYFGAKILRLGESPYDPITMMRLAQQHGVSVNPYVYLPFTAQVMAPLSLMTLHDAIWTWFWLNHVFLAAAFVLIAFLWPRQRRMTAFLAMVAVAALFYPLTRTLTAGQMNCALLLMLAIYWLAASKGRYGVAGAALAVAALFKIAPALLILVLLRQRRWRLAAWSMGWGAALLILSALWCGPGRYTEFIPILKQMGYGTSVWSKEAGFDFYRDPFNQSFNAFFHRALTDNPTTQPWVNAGAAAANQATIAATLIVLAAGGTIIAMKRRNHSAQNPELGTRNPELGTRNSEPGTRNPELGTRNWCLDDLDLAIGVILMLLTPSLYWDHYAVLLFLPIALILRHSPRPWIIAAVAIAGILIAIPQGFFFQCADKWFARGGLGVLMFSMQLWATLLLFAVALYAHRRETKAS
ncbi:MAG: glycosyltransferase family 87 protein [Candidatus Sumerlaeota bacterium]|nr:glycosyltransferase family 87 protein [Candidatus Sumerlaeota bacterium]